LVSDLSLRNADSNPSEVTAGRQKKSSVGPKIAILLLGCGSLAAFGGLKWQAAHRELQAQSVEIVADTAEVNAPVAGTVQQLLVKPGQAVKSGDLLAVVISPELVEKYRQAEAHLAAAKKQDTTTEAAILPPHIEGNLIPSGPAFNLNSIKPLPTSGPISGQAPSSMASPTASPAAQKVARLTTDVSDAEKMVSQCTDTLQAMQADLDAAQSASQPQALPLDDLKSAVELAKSKRDKFQGLYNDGIISRAEFQQKQNDLDAAQSNLDQATQTANSGQGKIKSKQDDLDLAKKALAASKANLAKQQQLLAKAQMDAKNAPITIAAPKFPIAFLPPKPPKKLFLPHFKLPAPSVTPLSVVFSPDKHVQAEHAVLLATTNLQLVIDQLKGCRLVAPSDGSISKVEVREGQPVDTKSPILEIMQPSTQRIVASFPHSTALRIRYGQSCRVTFDSMPHRVFAGQVSRFLDNGSAGKPAKLEISLPDELSVLADVPAGTGTHVSVLPR
jgi:multidrug resistance efflux pump